MPVRIYDIAKKLGIENKKVLAKAKDLGISGARVPSSSLDKITAEYLEQQLAPPQEKKEPETPTQPVEQEPVLIIAPPKEEKIEEEPADDAAQESAEEEAAPTTDTAEPEETEPSETQTEVDVADHEPEKEEMAEVEPETDSETAAAPEPEKVSEPPIPKVGEKVGFIQLPTRPVASRAGAKQLKKSDRRKEAKEKPRKDKFGRRDGRDAAPPAEARPKPKEDAWTAPQTGEIITLKPPIIVRDLAQLLNRKPFQLIADLMELNVFANVNQAIEEITAKKLCAKYGYRFELEKREKGAGFVQIKKKIQLDTEDKPEDLTPRAPVVTIMGHVDHGKTTLLDHIRKSNVVAKEAGGITQHIGAYTIYYPHPERPDEIQQLTFLDTPGHEAFSAMRARGANVTDIVILVVAANDGVMPQTLEALNHAKAAEVPIIVAVNKCDHPAADPLKVRTQLQDRGLVSEEWGGETIFVDVSAIKGEGIDKLLEMLLLQAEIMELKANSNRDSKGNVIESGLAQGGPTATVLVRKGTLKVGNVVVCGPFWGKARALINEEGERLKSAAPSVAVKLLGLNGVPEAGLEFNVVKSEKDAKRLTEERREELRLESLDSRKPKVTLESLFTTLSEESAKVLKVVVKADTQGSAEAIVDALKKIKSDKVSLDVIHHAVGTVTESDVLLASASKAIILGFHTRVDNGVHPIAKREGVQIKLYGIIYELVEQVKEAMSGLLDPLLKEVNVGTAEIRKVFSLSKGGNVAGCFVTNGRILKGKLRVKRNDDILFEGVTQSLRRFQDEVNEVRSGLECGIRLDGFNDFQEHDVVECYTMEKVAQQL